MNPSEKTEEPPKDRRRKTIVLHEISLKTMTLMVLFAAGLWVLTQLLPVMLVLVMALIIVGAMSPSVRWLKEHSVPRGAGVAMVFISFVFIAVLLITLTLPTLLRQVKDLIAQEPALRARAVDYLASSPLTTPFADALGELPDDVLMKKAALAIFSYSDRIAEIAAYVAAAFFLALYILLDRDRLRGGLYAVVPRSHHLRLAHVLWNLETIVGGYILGQLITSALMVVFVLLLLTAFSVPNALAIAVFAGVVDVLPYVGVFLALLPAALAALPQGPVVTITILIAMVVYEELESRLLIPRIYGRVMRLPSSVVLFALIAGGMLMGITGAFLALPAAATIRMLIEEFSHGLPGEPSQLRVLKLRRKDDRSVLEYLQRTEGLPAEEAAAVAVEILRSRQKDQKAKRAAAETPETPVDGAKTG